MQRWRMFEECLQHCLDSARHGLHCVHCVASCPGYRYPVCHHPGPLSLPHRPQVRQAGCSSTICDAMSCSVVASSQCRRRQSSRPARTSSAVRSCRTAVVAFAVTSGRARQAERSGGLSDPAQSSAQRRSSPRPGCVPLAAPISQRGTWGLGCRIEWMSLTRAVPDALESPPPCATTLHRNLQHR